jgi:hypothetical protein
MGEFGGGAALGDVGAPVVAVRGVEALPPHANVIASAQMAKESARARMSAEPPPIKGPLRGETASVLCKQMWSGTRVLPRQSAA